MSWTTSFYVAGLVAMPSAPCSPSRARSAWPRARARCVGQLHCYSAPLPSGDNPHWPKWNRPWWWAQRDEVGISGLAWCHACLHVGRTLESSHQETLGLVHRFAQQNEWHIAKTLASLNALDSVEFGPDELRGLLEELRASRQTTFEAVEEQYHGRGIGTALCRASLGWARRTACSPTRAGRATCRGRRTPGWGSRLLSWKSQMSNCPGGHGARHHRM